MSEFKGTLGPWIWQSENGSGFWHWLGPVNCSPLDRVADDGSAWGEYGASIDVDSPNARLIAAAPEILEALQALFDDYKQLADSGDAGNWSLEDTDAGKKAIAALAKVLGQ